MFGSVILMKVMSYHTAVKAINDNHFYYLTNALNIQNLEAKIYVVNVKQSLYRPGVAQRVPGS